MTRRFAATLAVAALLLGGCGITTEKVPREIEAPRGPFPVFTPATAAPPGDNHVAERLCFVRDGRLVAVTRRLSTAPTLAEQFAHLLAGPTNAERDQTLTTALTGTPTVSPAPSGTAVAVEVPAAGIGAGRSDEAVAYGQVVCTLAGRSDVSGVVFTREGQIRGVPRGDGSLSEGPLSAVDYADIMS
ncbi:Sporulation and spore germination [Asanoa hainanensis]|uniref:Sporulation and spore germination n=1 Tax=Asanoa hainanensis TaxID=560556 RepID=A0A239PEM8_9ACTN|nr:GerMN domain-containing protein [Asanoa hainanensis]SNT65490.1 Sporulation and spore germination [Asanoa hainanensis]